MGAYDNDHRVVRREGDGTWPVFDLCDDAARYCVAQCHRDRKLIPDLFVAMDSDGHAVPGVAEGAFDDVVHALIGDPQ